MVAHRVSLATAFALTFSCWREAFAAYDVVTLRFYKAEAVPQCMEGEMIQHVPVDPDECQLSYNFSCGCVGETKVLVREQYWPKCTNQTRTIRNVTPFGECGYWGDGQDFIAEENGACPSCCQCKSDSHSNCSIFGDPHVKVFDENTNTLSLLGLSNELGAARTETEQEHLQTNNVALAPHTRKFGWGDFWLVKSDKVKIQARYRKTYYPKAKHPLNGTYLTELAVGGDFLRGSVLLLRPRQRKVIWKTKGTREEILTSLPSSFHAPLGLHHIWASYHNKTKLVKDPTKEDLGMEIELPNCVHMTVNRWKSHLDLLLSMPPGNGGIAGIDGQCGNYNQDVADDTAALIDQRIGYHIPKSERLFED